MKHMRYFLIAFFIVACDGIGQGGGSQDEAAPAQLSETDQQIADAMVEEHGEEEPVATPAATTEPSHPVITEGIAYGELEGQNLRGYLSMPSDTTGPLPGLIVIHEWWGLNDNIKQTAERLAAEGYVTLAVDLYDGKVAAVPKEAMQLSQGLMKAPESAERNLVAAYEYLEQAVGSPRIGVIGWCMGGALVNENCAAVARADRRIGHLLRQRYRRRGPARHAEHADYRIFRRQRSDRQGRKRAEVPHHDAPPE